MIESPSSETTPAKIRRGLQRYSHLDGLRGIAAFLVVTHHILFAFWPGAVTGDDAGHDPIVVAVRHSPLAIFANGQTPVCVFFILSGFVLTRKYFDAPASLPRLAGDLSKRGVRLFLAAHPAAILAAAVKWGGFYYNKSASVFTGSAWLEHYRDDCSLGELIRYTLNPMTGLSPVTIPVCWTLFIELWASYAIFCVVAVCCVLPVRLRITTYACLFILSRAAAIGNTPGVGYFAYFVFGLACADFETTIMRFILRPRSFAAKATFTGLIVVVILVLIEAQLFLTPAFRRIIRICFESGTEGLLGILVFLIMLTFRPIQELSNRLIPQYLGRISVGLYLVHVPVLFSLGSGALYMLMNRSICSLLMAKLMASFVTVILSIVFGYVYSVVFDKFAIETGRRLGRLVESLHTKVIAASQDSLNYQSTQ